MAALSSLENIANTFQEKNTLQNTGGFRPVTVTLNMQVSLHNFNVH